MSWIVKPLAMDVGDDSGSAGATPTVTARFDEDFGVHAMGGTCWSSHPRVIAIPWPVVYGAHSTDWEAGASSSVSYGVPSGRCHGRGIEVHPVNGMTKTH